MRTPRRLLVLKNGPVHGLEDGLSRFAEVLSSGFEGEIWVRGSFSFDAPIGRFHVRVVDTPESGGANGFFEFSRLLLRHVTSQRRMKLSTPGVVVASDPFKVGILGALCARRLSWPLVTEVNGAFGNPALYRETTGGSRWLALKSVRRTIAGLVLRESTGVRLLYPEQLDGFVRPPPSGVVRCFPEYVMVERFYRQAEEPFVLHVGHPFHLKGCDLLIAAFNSIHARFPAWRLVVIGHGLEEHIKVRPSWLEVLPGISHSAVADWMSRCSVFVLASRSEAMGRALVEAAAAGKPRIAARVDGTYTTIRHGIDGLLVPANDAEALATALSELLADRELRVRLGDAGHRRAFSDFGAERYVQELTSLTDSALLRFSR